MIDIEPRFNILIDLWLEGYVNFGLLVKMYGSLLEYQEKK
jgi:hypothetical protein